MSMKPFSHLDLSFFLGVLKVQGSPENKKRAGRSDTSDRHVDHPDFFSSPSQNL